MRDLAALLEPVESSLGAEDRLTTPAWRIQRSRSGWRAGIGAATKGAGVVWQGGCHLHSMPKDGVRSQKMDCGILIKRNLTDALT